MSTTTTTTRDDHPWTNDEIQAVSSVRQTLITEKGLTPSSLTEEELIYITLISKCRVNEAVTKYLKYRHTLLEDFGITSLLSSTTVVDRTNDDTTTLDSEWPCFAVAGTNPSGLNISWVTGRMEGTPVSSEQAHIRACLLYTLAVHADRHTLRNGTVMVIDNEDCPKKVKHGNEKKLQVAYQGIPCRPQAIYITGTTRVTRLVINALIAFASTVTRGKILARIQFVTREGVRKELGDGAMPEMVGGEKRLETDEWVMERLANFPRMNLTEVKE